MLSNTIVTNIQLCIIQVVKVMCENNITLPKALNIVQDIDKSFLAGGDIIVGDFILLIDSDTRVPEDCILPTIVELMKSPKVVCEITCFEEEIT